MSKASVLVLSALALSAAIVALSWTLGGPAELAVDDDLAAPQFRPPAGLRAPDQDDQSPVQRVQRAEVRSEMADGRVQVFSFAEIEPRSNFVSDFTDPRAELYLTRGRLVVIEAASGTFLHPGNDPQRGSFDRDVVVTFFEAASDAQLDIDDPTQIVFRLFLDDETNFDRDLGRIITQGPVELTGPAASFTGRGLNLTYSAEEERVAEMVVTEGRELRLRRNDDAEAVAPPDNSASASPERQRTPVARTINQRAATTTANDAASTPNGEVDVTETAAPDGEPAQYYQARFNDTVLVRVGQDEATLAGGTLEVVFAFTDGDDKSRDANAGREPNEGRRAPLHAAANANHALAEGKPSTDPATLTDAAPALPALPSRSLFTPRDDDVRITWTGPLTLLPLDGPPVMLQGDADPDAEHALLTLLGSPARVTVPDPQGTNEPTTFTADTLAYATGNGHLEAIATDARPFRLDAPGQGTLTGQRLTLRPDASDEQADIRGPGRLTAAGVAQSESPEPPLDVQFAQRLRLTFAPDGDAEIDKTSAPLAALGRLTRANFRGEVQARAADPDRPNEPSLQLTSDILLVDFDANTHESSSAPALRQLTARRNVLAQHAGQSLAADDLVADFVLSPAKPSADASPTGDNEASEPPSTRLATLTATGRVTALLPDEHQPELPPTTLTAHRLVATPDEDNPNAGTLLLLAEDHAADAPRTPPARITTPTATLTGPRLELNQTDQSLHAQGPGQLTQSQNDQTLAVAFHTSLIYRGTDTPFPTADALGQVVATSTSPTQAARLEAHRLALTFTAPHKSPKPTDSVRASTPLPTLQLRTAHATIDPVQPSSTVTLNAQNHPAGQPDAPASRLTLVGPDILLAAADVTSPYAQVTGQGQMYLEDYGNPKNAQAGDDSNALQLAGQGVTLFTWNDRLHLDLLTNDVTMHGRVGMNHNPLNDQPNVQLVADRLRADLTEEPPFVQMLRNTPDASPRDATTEPTLRGVQLDGRVIVQQLQRKVFADQLLFTADDRNVLLQAQPGNTVRAVDESDRRANLEAEAILWNLETDRLRITDYQGGLVPIQ